MMQKDEFNIGQLVYFCGDSYNSRFWVNKEGVGLIIGKVASYDDNLYKIKWSHPAWQTVSSLTTRNLIDVNDPRIAVAQIIEKDNE